MKQEVTFSSFTDSFSDSYKDNFSYNGKRALYDYLIELEESTGEEIELDTVAICCDYSEYSTALMCAIDYGFEPDKEQTAEEQESEALRWLNDRTQVIEFQGGIIISQF